MSPAIVSQQCAAETPHTPEVPSGAWRGATRTDEAWHRAGR